MQTPERASGNDAYWYTSGATLYGNNYTAQLLSHRVTPEVYQYALLSDDHPGVYVFKEALHNSKEPRIALGRHTWLQALQLSASHVLHQYDALTTTF